MTRSTIFIRDGSLRPYRRDRWALADERKLGKENRALSKRDQLRFGSNGSVVVETNGRKQGSWYDHECGSSGGPWDLLRQKAGLVDGAAVDWLRRFGIDIARNDDIVAVHDYVDEASNLLFQVCRTRSKSFPQRRPDGRGGWIWSTKGVQRVLYRLPELLVTPPEAPVFIVEGERGVDNLLRLGFTATCNPGVPPSGA